jgi:hypothetical protein
MHQGPMLPCSDSVAPGHRPRALPAGRGQAPRPPCAVWCSHSPDPPSASSPLWPFKRAPPPSMPAFHRAPFSAPTMPQAPTLSSASCSRTHPPRGRRRIPDAPHHWQMPPQRPRSAPHPRRPSPVIRSKDSRNRRSQHQSRSVTMSKAKASPGASNHNP